METEETESAADETSKEAQRLWRLAQSPENREFAKTAPPPSTWTAEQTIRLRRLWNGPRAAS